MSRQKMIVLGVVLVAMAIACTANAALTPKASADFDTYKYEMDYMPTDMANYDLDSNSQPDFVLVVDSPASWTTDGSGFSAFDCTDDEDTIYIGYADPNQAWPGATTFAGGFTLEYRVQVLTMSPGDRGTFVSQANAGSSTTMGFLNIRDDGTSFGNEAQVELGTHDNTDGFQQFPAR